MTYPRCTALLLISSLAGCGSEDAPSGPSSLTAPPAAARDVGESRGQVADVDGEHAAPEPRGERDSLPSPDRASMPAPDEDAYALEHGSQEQSSDVAN